MKIKKKSMESNSGYKKDMSKKGKSKGNPAKKRKGKC